MLRGLNISEFQLRKAWPGGFLADFRRKISIEVAEMMGKKPWLTLPYGWYNGTITVKPLSLPAPTPTTCPNIRKHCVLWDKRHMSMIMALILQRTA